MVAQDDDREILRLRDAVHKLVEQVQGIALKQTEAHGAMQVLQRDVTSVKDTVFPITALVTAAALLDRRIGLVEKLLFGFITIILVAVVTAWVNGIIILPHTTGG